MLKWQLMKDGTSLLCFFLCLSLCGLAAAQTTNLQNEIIAPSSGVFLEFGSGLGAYPGIVIDPRAEQLAASQEGAKSADAGVNHVGVPLSFSSGYRWAYSRGLHQFSLIYLHMTKIDSGGSSSQQQAGYQRLELAPRSTLNWFANPRWLMPYFIGTVVLRKSSFSSVSQAHHLTSVAPVFGLGTHLGSRWKLESQLGQAIYTDFAYSRSGFFSGETLSDSQAKMNMLALSGIYRFSSGSELQLSLSREMINASLADVREYNRFGYSLSPRIKEAREYHLETIVAQIGFLKKF